MLRVRHRSLLCALAAMLVATGCEIPDREVGPADARLLEEFAAYRALDTRHRVVLGDSAEPGQRLYIFGQLTRNEGGEALREHPIRVYHADAAGLYNETVGDEPSARINGIVHTDSAGRFLIETVMPGEPNQHVHTAVDGATPEAYDFYFLQHLSVGTLRWARGTDQAVVLELKESGGALIARGDIVARGTPTPTTASP